MIRHAVAAVALVTLALLGWRLHGVEPVSPANTAVATLTSGDTPSAAEPGAGPVTTTHDEDSDHSWGVVPPAPATGVRPSSGLNTDAVAALRASRNGDPRAPTVGADERLRESAPDNLTDNYTDYRQWQHDQRLAGYARYVAAANEKLARIDEHLQWGASNGVSEPDLAAAREKRTRLAAARDKLVSDYPDLALPATDSLPRTGEADSDAQKNADQATGKTPDDSPADPSERQD